MASIFYYHTMYGRMGINAGEDGIENIWFENINKIEGNIEETHIHREAARQIEEYFKGDRKEFQLKLNPKGTKFQKDVWKALKNIPYGETRNYKEIAEIVGSPNAARAVGMCNNKNPIPIIYPCHRVLGSDGSLTGYAYGLDMKQYLLDMERENK